MTEYNIADVKFVEQVVANKRKLVTVRKIDAIDPIEGADAIEAATIEGWKVVVKKGDFKVGDPCVYFEIDSFLPTGNPAWQFLVDKSSREFEGVVGHRLRTIKLRGQISQGLVLPMSAVPQITDTDRSTDQSDLLGIKKWEAPLPPALAGKSEGYFPSFIRKTDQERCQNLKAEIFGFDTVKTKLDITPEQAINGLDVGRLVVEDGVVYSVSPAKADPNAMYEITMKLDGSSMTAFVRKSFDSAGVMKLGVCSRNLELKLNDENAGNSFVRMFYDSGLKAALEKFYEETGRSIAVQGELMGPGIQGNREGLKENKLFVFDIYDIDRGEYLAPAERRALTERLLECAPTLGHVPVIAASANLLDTLGIKDIDGLLKFAEGPSLNHPIREGLVFKRLDGKFSFKAISNQFLAREKD